MAGAFYGVLLGPSIASLSLPEAEDPTGGLGGGLLEKPCPALWCSLTLCYWTLSFLVDWPIKKWWFSIVLLVYQRVNRVNPLDSHHFHGMMRWPATDWSILTDKTRDMFDLERSGRTEWHLPPPSNWEIVISWAPRGFSVTHVLGKPFGVIVFVLGQTRCPVQFGMLVCGPLPLYFLYLRDRLGGWVVLLHGCISAGNCDLLRSSRFKRSKFSNHTAFWYARYVCKWVDFHNWYRSMVLSTINS